MRPVVAAIGKTALLVVLMALLVPAQAWARPTYFGVLTERYGIEEDSRLDVCAVCHIRWDGTGPRNPFGTAVQQHLYVGKSIVQSLEAVEADDSDGDGFSNIEELITYLTLPGYSCDNFHQAVDAPQGYDTYAVPMVATCLEPLDIHVAVQAVAILADAGGSAYFDLNIINNGSELTLIINSYDLLADDYISVSGPAVPFEIPVGGSQMLRILFSPPATGALVSTILELTSNDPDESLISVPIIGLSAIKVLAPVEARARCLKQVSKKFGRFAKRHLREWSRCYTAELGGRACNEGNREVRLSLAAAKLANSIGGRRDRHCGGKNLTPSLLDFPNTCGLGCSDIYLNSMASLAQCLICRQHNAADDILLAASGASPPDLPSVAPNSEALSCRSSLLTSAIKTSGAAYKAANRCRLANVGAEAPVDCDQALTSTLAKVRTRLDRRIGRCSVGAVGGCLADLEAADPQCLADKSIETGLGLSSAVFGLEE